MTDLVGASVDSTSTYVASVEEQAFVAALITPKFVEIGKTFDNEIAQLCKELQRDLVVEFASVRAEVKAEVTQLRETIRTHAA